MIITKTPVRVSFFGGGTDYPDYFKQYGGAILSTSIDKYIFITVKSSEGLSEHKYRVAYSRLELCHDVNEIVHPVVRECIKFLKIKEGLEINIFSDLPARSGIGSSSSFTVGLLHALYALKGQIVSQTQLANEAIYVEQVLLGERVGVQDQYAAAIGGLNYYELQKSGNIIPNPIYINNKREEQLQSHLILFYTGLSRYAHQILEEQIQKTKENRITPNLDRMKQMVYDGLDILTTDKDIRLFGELLHEAWIAKRGLSSAISNDFLDSIYNKAMNAGAIGGKLLGAGGGGFFVFFASPEKHDLIRKELSDLIEIPFRIENNGTRVIYYAPN